MSNPGMLSFDEFHALSQRKREKEKEKKQRSEDAKYGQNGGSLRNRKKKEVKFDTQQANGRDKGQGSEGKPPSSVGVFLELPEVQLILACLIFMDVFCALGELLLPSAPVPQGNTKWWIDGILHALNAFTGFSSFFFAFELVALFIAFKIRFLSHPGYLLDVVVVSLCLYAELVGTSKACHLLGFFRGGWRAARLAAAGAGRARAEADAARGEAEGERARAQGLEAEALRLRAALRREQEARRRTEAALQGYKDEVETLGEALRIAALDIAAAAGSELGSGSEFGEDDDSEGGGAGDEDVEGTVFVAPDGSFRRRPSPAAAAAAPAEGEGEGKGEGPGAGVEEAVAAMEGEGEGGVPGREDEGEGGGEGGGGRGAW